MTEARPPRIDPAALAERLDQAGLNARFRSWQAEFLGRFSNDVWRLYLDNGVQLIAKVPFRSAPVRDAERAFYRSLEERVRSNHDLPLPRWIGNFDGVLVLEYRPLHPFSFREGMTDEHTSAAIRALAGWHAAWWNRPPRERWLPEFSDRGYREQTAQSFSAAWRIHRTRLLEYLPAFAATGDALAETLADVMAALSEPATLIHGDAHGENVALTDQGAILLDWQEPRIANPGYDLAVLTTMSFPVRERRRVERDIVDRHARQLRDLNCQWPLAWRDYRLGVLCRAARIVEIAHLDFPSLPWVFRRSAAAAVDHEAVFRDPAP